MYLPKIIADTITEIEASGFEAYAVGGCVRDSLMGRQPSDWDITTSALPEDIEKTFSHFTVAETGLKHGTVTVVREKVPIEITTYRIDGEYTDCRRPASVRFTSNLADDLSRRDFTVNAMAYNPSRGIIDIFGGKNDLERKIIRCVGDPEKRFHEDALRIMRAIRFSAVLDFEIEKNTADAAKNCLALLGNISAERISAELNKLITAPDPSYVLQEFRDIIAQILPEVRPAFDFDQKNLHHCFDVWTHTVEAIRHSTPDRFVRLALLFHDLAKPLCAKPDKDGHLHFDGHPSLSAEIANRAMHRLKYDTLTRKTVCSLVALHDLRISADKISVKKALKNIGAETFGRLLEVKLADNLSKSPNFTERYHETLRVKEIYSKIISANECFSLKTLAVNGSDLIAHGMAPGKHLGVILDKLLDSVIEEKCENEKSALLRRTEVEPDMPCD